MLGAALLAGVAVVGAAVVLVRVFLCMKVSEFVARAQESNRQLMSSAAESNESLGKISSHLECLVEDIKQRVLSVSSLKSMREEFLHEWRAWKFGREPTGGEGSPVEGRKRA